MVFYYSGLNRLRQLTKLATQNSTPDSLPYKYEFLSMASLTITSPKQEMLKSSSATNLPKSN